MRLARLAGARCSSLLKTNIAGRIFSLLLGTFPHQLHSQASCHSSIIEQTSGIVCVWGGGGVHPTTNTDRLSQ